SFGMIMWEFTTGKKPFCNRPHDHHLILDILKGERSQITDDTPEFYADLMKRCWNYNPENRPTTEEIYNCLSKYDTHNIIEEKQEIITLAETKRQEIIKSDKFLSDTKNYEYHPESFYTSHPLNELIQQAETLNISSIEIRTTYYIKDADELINKLFEIFNRLSSIDKSDSTIRITTLSLGALKLLKDCTSCKINMIKNH